MRSILKPGIALLVIAAVAAAILGYVNLVTAEPIAKAELETTKASVEEIFPETGDINAEDIHEYAAEENGAYSDVSSYIEVNDKDGNLLGYAVSIETTGFSSGLKLMYGIDTQGIITGLSVIDCSNETPGLGANIKTNDAVRNQFKGLAGGELAVTKDGGEIEALTGATITSRAVANAANTSAEFVKNELLKGGAE